MNCKIHGCSAKKKREIRVAMLARYPLDYTRGGSVVHVSKLTEYLSYRDDVELHVITLSDQNKQFRIGNLNIQKVKK